MTQDTKVNNLLINKLSQQQFENIQTPSDTELYFVTDGVLEPTDITGALGYTPQSTDNLVTSVSEFSTHNQYPSAKLLYDTVGDIETALSIINGE